MNNPIYNSAFIFFKEGVKWGLTHQWINIKDELPTEGKYVLITDKFYRIHIGYRVENTWEDRYGNDIDATHWMPIPKLMES